MRARLTAWSLTVLACCGSASVAFFWSGALDPDQAGVAATEERLAAIRAAGPPWLPCKCTGFCTVNEPCLATDCAGDGVYCTQQLQTGDQQNKTCQGTSGFTCGPVTLSGCYKSFIQCESTISGCTCTHAVTTGGRIGTFVSC